MTVREPSQRRVFVVGHFPPPLHGMSVATARFTAMLEDRTAVTPLDISSNVHGRSLSHHLVRLARTLRAASVLARHGRRGDGLYVACDAGPGMLYTALVLSVARLRGVERYLHHHSYAYLTQPSRLMALVTRVGGRGTDHIVTCLDQAALLRDRYPRIGATLVLPITYVLDEPAARPPRPRPMRGRRIVLGHLGNLTAEKGLHLASATLAHLVAGGLDAELVLAGPTPTPAAASDLAAAMLAADDKITHLGAVHGAGKEAFFNQIDVFLFPTLYRNESFGIVVGEAMAHGVPVVAYRAGCLDPSWVGDGGLVLAIDQDFPASAARQVRAWADDDDDFAAAATAAFERAESGRHDGSRAAAALADRLVRSQQRRR